MPETVQMALPLPGLTPTATQPTRPGNWTQVIEAYLSDRQDAGAAQLSIDAFRRDLEFLVRLFPGRDPTSLSIQEARWATQQARRGVKAATAARRHGTWRAFYKWMTGKGWCTSPFRFGHAEATPRNRRQAPRYLLPEQAKKLLNAADNTGPAAAFLVRLALYTGAKPSEMIKIKVRDLDRSKGLVVIRGRIERIVPIPDDLFDAYDRFIQEELGDEVTDERSPVIPRTQRWMEQRLAQAARQVKDAVGFAPTFSTLRWTRAVWDLTNGVPESRVRLKLGFTELGWQMHVRHKLIALVPDAREGQTPAV